MASFAVSSSVVVLLNLYLYTQSDPSFIENISTIAPLSLLTFLSLLYAYSNAYRTKSLSMIKEDKPVSKLASTYYALSLVNGLFLGLTYLITHGLKGQSLVVRYVASQSVGCAVVVWSTRSNEPAAKAAESDDEKDE